MWKIRKIFFESLKLIIISLLICIILYLILYIINIISEVTIQNIVDHYIYTIGYDKIENNTISSAVFSIMGMIFIALLSAFLTISLFWRIDDVKLPKNIIIRKVEEESSTKFDSKIRIYNKGKNIYKLEALIIFYDGEGNKIYEYESQYSLLKRKKYWTIDMLETNEYLFHQIAREMLKESKRFSIDFILKYVDTSTGQETIRAIQYKEDNIIFKKRVDDRDVKQKSKVKVNKFIEAIREEMDKKVSRLIRKFKSNAEIANCFTKELKSIEFDLHLLDKTHHDCTTIRETVFYSEEISKKCFRVEFDFSVEDMHYGIGYFRFHNNPKNWKYFYKENATIELEILKFENIKGIIIEVKKGKEIIPITRKEIEPLEGCTIYKTSLQDDVVNNKTVTEEDFTEITELCLVVPKENVLEGYKKCGFMIGSIKITYPQSNDVIIHEDINTDVKIKENLKI